MLKTTLGYIISAVGLVSLALGVITPIRNALSIPAQLSSSMLTTAGIVIVVLGLILSLSANTGKKLTEVPIYHGDKVVGYRRIHQK